LWFDIEDLVCKMTGKWGDFSKRLENKKTSAKNVRL